MPLIPLLAGVDARLAESRPGSTPVEDPATFRSALTSAMGGSGTAAAMPAAPTVPPAVLPQRIPGAPAAVKPSGRPAPGAEPDMTAGGDIVEPDPGSRRGVAPGDDGLLSAFIPEVPGTPPAADPVAALVRAATLPASTHPGDAAAPPSHRTPAAPAHDGLHPAFSDRLERVIQRMQEEFGYTVEVVEAVRSQERQDALFRQGRGAPGPVVTWTRASLHTEGLAADLLVDGTWNNPVAYDRLARIASEEGLRTLGPRDRGHLELPRTLLAHGGANDVPDEGPGLTAPERSIQAAALRTTVAPRRATGPGPLVPPAPPGATQDNPAEAPAPGMARIAALARVAPVAAVAPVAGVARVAAVARPGSSDEGAPPPPVDRTTVVAQRLAPVEARADASHRDSPDDGHARHAGPEQPVAAAEPPATDRLVASLLRAFEADPRDRTAQAAGRLDGTVAPGASVAERVAGIAELRDGAAERPLSSVLLRLERPGGGEDRIRVGLRGIGVGAAFEMSDAGLAEDLGRHLPDLARALERQGLDPEVVTVRAVAGKDAGAGAWQAAAGERDALRAASAGAAGSGSAPGREGRGGPAREDHPHDEPARQRPRRESRGDR